MKNEYFSFENTLANSRRTGKTDQFEQNYCMFSEWQLIVPELNPKIMKDTEEDPKQSSNSTKN